MRPINAHAPSLLPREHGAYGQLAFPMLSALVFTGARAPAIEVALAAVATFLMHEPLLVALGLRGSRAEREQGPRARRRVAGLAVVASALLSTAVATSAVPLASSIGLCVGLGVGVLSLVVSRRERTALGEMLAASALASSAVPIAAAGGAGTDRGLGLWLAWTVASVVVILPIRALVAPSRRTLARVVASGVAVALFTVFAGVGLRASAVPNPWAVAPATVFALLLCAFAPSPKRMRTVGWGAVAVSALTTTALVWSG